MPIVEVSKVLGASPVRALSDAERAQRAARLAAAAAAEAEPGTSGPIEGDGAGPVGVRIEIGETLAAALDPAAPPVDAERVAKIRAALRDGSYPLVPTKIADALIAAQIGIAEPQ